ncbi:MFS transporter [Actinomadura sp. B10D3]|uniref:MFS transporter n=1 Tax=Actinomadura sp. B10D3 TaxID=3153557 RepID=UPI00325F163A
MTDITGRSQSAASAVGAETAVTSRDARRIAVAAFVGTAMEWYDYFLYGTAASLVFNRLYFASGNTAAATLAAFASFGVGFLARPIGAVVFGHIGDRYGRRVSLLATVTMIGVATGLIGMLPTYAAIGIAAPVLLTLLRVLQGIAMGGEWSGAITLAVEHAPPERRVRYAVLPQVGSPVGTLLSSGAFTLVSLLPKGQFDSWGWRLPFLGAVPLLLVALYLRRRVQESPLFRRILETEEPARLPAIEIFSLASGRMLLGLAVSLLPIAGFYLMTTFAIGYGTETLGVSRSLMVGATVIAAAIQIGVLFVFGRIAERLGAALVCCLGSLATAALAFPVFMLIDTARPLAVVLGMTVAIAVQSVPFAVTGAVLADLFPARLRYSGIAISYSAAGVISGFVPLAAASLVTAAGGRSWPAATVLLVIALMTAAGGFVTSLLRK